MQRANDRILFHEDTQRIAYRHFLSEHLARHGFAGRMPKQADAVEEVHAYVNHGRWVADCPSPHCGGAVVLSREEAFFLCPNCCNADNGGQWYHARFPADRHAVEHELVKRPHQTTRNWHTHETARSLRAENHRHGVSS